MAFADVENTYTYRVNLKEGSYYTLDDVVSISMDDDMAYLYRKRGGVVYKAAFFPLDQVEAVTEVDDDE